MRLLPAFLLLFTLTAAAQQTGQNAPEPGNNAYTMSVTTKLVIETVVVKDKKGDPIDGLTKNDFTVTENGIPQTISFFEHQQLAQQPATAPLSQPGQITIYDKLARVKIAPEAEGSTRYKDHRLLCFYFDMTSMQPSEQLRALKAAQAFIREQMQSDDLISILRYAGSSVDVLQDFTGDRSRLLSILETMIVGEGQGLGESSADDSTSDTGAAFGQDDSEFNIFNTDRQLSALQTAADMLAHLSEKKLLIYFASGLTLNGLNNQAQLHATINAAIRAGVSFWPIDARGLVAQAPLGDATKGSPGGEGMYSGTSALAVTTNFQQSQDTLYTLAADSSGKALLDNNDLTRGIHQAEQSISNYYIIGYYTTNAAKDGKFRRIRISLNDDKAASLDYRQGYFAPKEFSKFTSTDKERQLEDALMLPDPITELTIAMEINYFQLNRAEYFVPIAVKIPGRELALAKRGGSERTLIDFVGEIKDSYGTTITNLRDSVNIKLSDATAGELAKHPIEYEVGFTLLPGKYTIKILARDNETGRIGTYQASFLIPNLNRETKRIATSSVVLSSQRIDAREALYNVAKQKELNRADAVNPLVQNGQKLVPSITRVFHKTWPIYIYMQAYEQGAAATHPLLAFVSFYRNTTKVFETQPVEVSQGMNNSLRTISVNFDISIDQLAPGEYNCQVTLLDPAEQKSSFWRAPIMLVP